jgi:hypothetical protein
MADRQTIQKLTVSEKLLIAPNAQVTGLNVNHVQGLKSALDRKIWLESPAFTGTPTAPTPNSDANGNQIANAEFVNTVIQAAVDNLVGGAPGALDTLKEISDAINNDVTFNTTVTGYLAGKLDASADEFGGNAATASDAKPGSALAETLSNLATRLTTVETMSPVTGATGVAGVNGVAGVAGVRGSTGTTGEIGPDGQAGVGVTGPEGPAGDVAGESGVTGPTGPTGGALRVMISGTTYIFTASSTE